MEPSKLQITTGSAGTKGGRRPTEVPADPVAKPNPEVSPRARRRYLTVAYKLRVLDTVAELRQQGQGAVGAYLRKEGLYYSSITSWENLRDKGLLTGMKKGSRERSHDTLITENKQLRRELEKTKKTSCQDRTHC